MAKKKRKKVGGSKAKRYASSEQPRRLKQLSKKPNALTFKYPWGPAKPTKDEISDEAMYSNTLEILSEKVKSFETMTDLLSSKESHYIVLHLDELDLSAGFPKMVKDKIFETNFIQELSIGLKCLVSFCKKNHTQKKLLVVSHEECRDCNPLVHHCKKQQFIPDRTMNTKECHVLHNTTISLQLLNSVMQSDKILSFQEKLELWYSICYGGMSRATQDFILYDAEWTFPLLVETICSLQSFLLHHFPGCAVHNGFSWFWAMIAHRVRLSILQNQNSMKMKTCSLLCLINALPLLKKIQLKTDEEDAADTSRQDSLWKGMKDTMKALLLRGPILGCTGFSNECDNGGMLSVSSDPRLFAFVCPVVRCFSVQSDIVTWHPWTFTLVALSEVLDDWRKILAPQGPIFHKKDFPINFREELQSYFTQSPLSLAHGEDLILDFFDDLPSEPYASVFHQREKVVEQYNE